MTGTRSLTAVCLALLCSVFVVAPTVTAGPTYTQEYVANGVATLFCEGEDAHLDEPWCIGLNVVHGGEESVIGGAVWDVESHLGSSLVYRAVDDWGSPHTVLGISDHFGIEDSTEGCGALTYTIPEGSSGDEIDHGIHLVAQISVLHTTEDLVLCIGSTGTASIDIFA